MGYQEDPALPGYWLYDGLRIQAAVETHRFVVDWLAGHHDSGTLVLDIAAGEGALSKQLLDRGFAVACTSWNDKCRVDAPQYRVDLDNPFAPDDVGGRRYAAICAVEIAEHVENPSAFLRSCAGALAPGGTLMISTPNVESIAARVQWLIHGHPRIFSEDEVRANRHISMLWRQGFEVLIEHAGLKIVERRLLGRFRMSNSWSASLKRAAYAGLARLLPGDTCGTTRVYILTHSGAEAVLHAARRVY